ncbi:MAG: ROK family protein [Clostridia bacterium]|nr:ROK family protein [Clostridia bacterium]
MKNIGIDIGGTFIKAAIVENTGKIILSSKTPTPKDGASLPEKVVEIIRELTDKAGVAISDIEHIGMGVPGVCDVKHGRVISCTNIEGCSNVSICEYVSKQTGVPSFIDNDANCAALGEYMMSKTKPNGFVFVTLGTGVGGGIILNGKILRGINCAAGEIGHIVIDKAGERCNCGRYGCWERYASVSALVRQTKQAGFTGNVTGKTVFEERIKGNRLADEVLDTWLRYVAEGICDLVNIFQPEVVAIGGGISREGDIILKPVREFVEKNVVTAPTSLKKTEIKISQLFNDAGVVGASFLYTQN